MHPHPSTHKDGVYTNVMTVIDGTRARLNVLRKKIHAAQQAAKKGSSASGSERSGHSTPKPAVANPSTTPAISGTPPRA